MNQEQYDALKAQEQELWDKVQEIDKTKSVAVLEWLAVRHQLEQAEKSLAIEIEVQKRLAECKGATV